MALYRCAACGSPNVVTDTQIGGLEYDYLKGAVGTAILGAGGAAAGIKNQRQQVFKCPDCGMTLSYAMPEEIKQVIDLGVMSLNARAHLNLRGSPIEWEYLTSKFKNIESGGADELAMELKQQKDLKEKHGMELLRSKGTATQEEFDAFEKRFRKQMGARHKFDPEDRRAIGMWSTLENFMMLNGMMNGIALFIWVIGIGTLTAGIVGVSNIMLITVRERTREFGIRKAIGATPFSILKLIIIESILITAVFGYLGMILGIGLTEGINSVMEMMNAGKNVSQDDMSIFLNPTVNLSVALSATALIIGAGVLAGYFPARKAVKITAIEAMRNE